MDNIVIRPASVDDLSEMIHLFRDTIKNVNKKDYSAEQITVWASPDIDIKRWQQSIKDDYTFVAENSDNLIGFSTLQKEGNIHLLYVHKNYQRKGIASVLLEKLEKKAIELGLKKLTTHSSITALPFFESKGFFVVRQQEVILNSVSLTNFFMTREL